ncbi:DUF465 domain-containing protein [Litoricolaceae bacterium]|nr:DUF465 domain-containing protein [Litorivicinaceae bacterium]
MTQLKIQVRAICHTTRSLKEQATQNVEHHCLSQEFPELKERIHDMKLSNAHFKKLHDEYTELSKQIENMITEVTPASNITEETLKSQRVHLKDQLYGMLIG